MKKSCEQIAEMLVDYADGQLSASESRQVAEHLAKCEHCQSTLKALQRSIELAGVIWDDSLAETDTIHIPVPGKTRRIHWRRYAAVAASILIVIAISVTWRTTSKPAKPELTLAEIERRISESGRAARLLAAAELLAGHADAGHIVQEQYRYIAETYPQTRAAAEARLRIE
jgi:anti-sigma factor RsiW